jgi:hypothetical protein
MPRPLYLRERAPGTRWIGGWVDPRAGRDDLENRKFLNLQGLELRPLGRPARSQPDYAIPCLRRNWSEREADHSFLSISGFKSA